MSDAQLPPPDPDEVERDDETTPSENSASDASDGAAVAGEGPALLTPPVPSSSPEPLDEDPTDDNAEPR